jgi:ubiquinone/menaquinone biosynthesis C-methylase UbiE
MFTKSAQFYDALYHFKDYAAASTQVDELIQQRHPEAQTLVDVGCGTGKHLDQLRHHYQVEGLDLSHELLAIARERCPGVSFHKGDMVNFDLGHSFDVVTCLFSAIAYVRTLENLQRAVACMSRHLQPGGLLIIEPWFSPENYWLGRITANFFDDPELKIAWMYTSEIEGNVSIFNIHYLVGTPKEVTHFTERHEMGLFTPVEYTSAFQLAGLSVEYDAKGLFGRGMYIAQKGNG